MKILFAIPLVDRKKQWGRWHRGAGNNSFNYGIACLAGYLIEKEIDVSVVDLQFLANQEKDLAGIILKEKPNLIGISCFTPTYADAIRTANLCKAVSPDVKIVLGGAHPSLYPRETLKDNKAIDFVVFGEGEHTLYELMTVLKVGKSDFSSIKGLGFKINGDTVINEKRAFMHNLDDMPIPAYHIFPLKKYQIQATSYKRLPTYTMVASRGCPYSCTFCQVKEFLGTHMRHKSPEKLIAELKYLKDKFNARGIMFQDSTFTFDWSWLKKFCNLMVREKINLTWMCFTRADRVNKEMLSLMKNAGCYGMSYGAESANQKSLDLLKKNLKVEKIVESIELSLRMGFFVTTTYILGIPKEDESDVRNTIKLANRLATHIAHFYLPIPYPESEMYYQCRGDGGIRKGLCWEDFNMFDDDNPVYVNPLIGKEKMINIKREAIRSYYLNPKVVMRNLRQLNSMEDIKRYYLAFKALLGFYF